MREIFCFSGPLIVVSLLAVSLVQAADDGQDSVTTIEVNAAKDFIGGHESTVILDVRTPVEYEMSHITGAVNVNVQDESFQDMIVALDPSKTYIVHCTRNPASSTRSAVGNKRWNRYTS